VSSARHLMFLFAILMIMVTAPCAAWAAGTPHWVHYKWLLPHPTLPKKVLVLYSDIEVVEVSAGGVEETVPKWSKVASRTVLKALKASLEKHGLKESAVPKYPGTTAHNLDEHEALYKLVVVTASEIGWPNKIRRFDYSIGPGLRKIAAKTGVNYAFMVYGRDYVSTAGRKARAIAGNIPIVNIFTGPPPKLGHSFIHLGLINLKTGDLLWMNSDYREGTTNLRDPGDAKKMLNTLFDWYPGIEEYREAYVN
jgi:hypothetical protein